MIDQNTINRIVDAANIVDVVSEYVHLRRSGTSYKGLCPFHDDTTPSFYVNPARGICKCFSCGEGGNAVHFIMKMEQLNYIEALRFLGKKYGIEVEERELTPEERQNQNLRESLFAVNEWASNYFHDTMLNNEDGRAVGLAYFRSRGFRDDIIEKFRLGFSLDEWDAMSKAAQSKGYKTEYLLKTGLSYQRDNGKVNDRYRGRVIFPWFAANGKIVAFGGRVLDARTKGVNQKYINSPESEIFTKSRELYGIFQAKKQIVKDDLVYMVEGYTDVISMHQCGVENVVANSGTALNEAQIRLLHRFTSNITLLYDGDAAGIKAALRGTDMLLAAGMNVKVLLLPDGDDPDSFARKHNATEFRQYVTDNQTDFILFKTNLLLEDAGHDPRKRSELAQNILRSISVIPDEIVRASYVHECSELLKMDEQMLLRECNKLLREYIKQQRQERERQRVGDGTSGIREQQHQPASNTPSVNTTTAPAADASRQELPPVDDNLIPPPDTEIPLQDDNLIPPPEVIPPMDVDVQSVTTTKPAVSPQERQLQGVEQLIMRLVVRYGECRICIQTLEGENAEIALAEFVDNELRIDELAFHNPVYQQMLQSVLPHLNEPDFKCSRFFLNSPSEEVSLVASDMLSDRYQLSKKYQITPENERIGEYISHLMLDYKYGVVKEEAQRLTRMLNQPDVKSAATRSKDVLQQLLHITAVQRAIAKRLGDRVLVK